jgi:hypothetical protein
MAKAPAPAAIHLSALAAKTRPVFELLAKRPALDPFVLIGGTAMALQMQHRLSEDLDFWLPAQHMSPYWIDRMMLDLREEGHTCNFTTSPASITAFKINTGEDLRRCAQDWTVNGVKVQLFCPTDVAFDHFRQYTRIERAQSATTFEVMGLEGIFAMKAYTIHRRTRSRDLVDLWHFVQTGKTVADILRTGLQASPSASADYAKSVLRGDVPLDAQDEGFELLCPGLTMATIYQDFTQRIDALEVEQARQVALASKL